MPAGDIFIYADINLSGGNGGDGGDGADASSEQCEPAQDGAPGGAGGAAGNLVVAAVGASIHIANNVLIALDGGSGGRGGDAGLMSCQPPPPEWNHGGRFPGDAGTAGSAGSATFVAQQLADDVPTAIVVGGDVLISARGGNGGAGGNGGSGWPGMHGAAGAVGANGGNVSFSGATQILFGSNSRIDTTGGASGNGGSGGSSSVSEEYCSPNFPNVPVDDCCQIQRPCYAYNAQSGDGGFGGVAHLLSATGGQVTISARQFISGTELIVATSGGPGGQGGAGGGAGAHLRGGAPPICYDAGSGGDGGPGGCAGSVSISTSDNGGVISLVSCSFSGDGAAGGQGADRGDRSQFPYCFSGGAGGTGGAGGCGASVSITTTYATLTGTHFFVRGGNGGWGGTGCPPGLGAPGGPGGTVSVQAQRVFGFDPAIQVHATAGGNGSAGDDYCP